MMNSIDLKGELGKRQPKRLLLRHRGRLAF
jgi:hypothetical protein